MTVDMNWAIYFETSEVIVGIEVSKKHGFDILEKLEEA